ncbi:hypothetical protein [Rhodanobacter denitrificans]|uniref:hypothetical protein n=1 Tax=Rhodanobacter denitrificans TaxID=666685 RepID=UPI0011C02586|nr:hypothetical protein [Rhodanobacter denitrificans]
MDKSPEFAEQYSRAERIRIALLGTTAGGLLVAFEKLWLSPWLREFSTSAQCRTVFGVSGTTVLWQGLFVGLPFLAGLVVAFAFGRRGFKILRDGQVPPLREKSLRLIRVRRGSGAKIIGYLHLVAFVPFLALGLWGYAQAEGLSRQAQHKAVDCSANNSFKPKPLHSST